MPMFGFSWRSLRPVTAFNWSKASDVLNIFLLKWRRNLCSLNRSNFKLKRSNFVLPKEQFFSIIQAISVDLLYQHFSKRGANSVALFKWWPHQGAMKCLLHPCPTWVESFKSLHSSSCCNGNQDGTSYWYVHLLSLFHFFL